MNADIGGALRFVATLAVIVTGAAGCKQKPPPDAPSRTPPRTDFAPEEFGIGRAHTKNAACNREIDQMLEQVRRCYNTQPTTARDGGSAENAGAAFPPAECDLLQRTDSDKIAQLKNTARCSH